jgi:hypothetical protein
MNPIHTPRLASGLLVAALSIASLTLSSTAYAADSVTPTVGEQTINSTTTSAACVQQVEAALKQGKTGLSVAECTSTVTTQTSAASVVTASTLAQASSALSASDYASLVAAAATSTVHSRTYSQKITDSYDQMEQQGRFYYNGTRVWVTTTYDGYKGSHTCINDYSIIPLGVGTVTNCVELGSTTNQTLEIFWNVTLGPIKGVGVNWNESQIMHVLDSGSIDY